jgi:acyl carrier protein
MGELGAGMDEVLASKVIAQIAAVKRIPVESITIDSTFKELAMDSLDAMNLLFALEEQLGISIPDEEASSIRDVRGALTAVKQKLSEQSEASS